MRETVLDAGPLIAFERAERRATALVRRIRERSHRLLVPAPVLAQVWRDGQRQARLAHLLGEPSVEVIPFRETDARAVGRILRAAGEADVVDGSVVWCALLNDAAIITTDPSDLRRLSDRVRIEPL